MRSRAAALPDWVGTDQSQTSFVTIQFINLPQMSAPFPLKVIVYSAVDDFGKVSLKGLEIRGQVRGQEPFAPQNMNCSLLSVPEASELLDLHDQDNFISTVSFLEEFSTPAMRSLLTSHLMGRIYLEHKKYGEHEEEDAELQRLGSRYSTFVSWGERSPALSIASATGKSVEEIHNRLKAARRRNYLPTAGQGVRGAIL